MASWRWAIGPWKAGASAKPWLQSQGGAGRELVTASARTLQLKLLEPSDASFTVDGRSVEAGDVEELITDLWVYRGSSPVFRGRVAAPTTDTVADRHTTVVGCRDYREVLSRRQLQSDLSWTSTEQSTIAWALVDHAMTQIGGNLGVVKGTWPTTGITRPSVTFKQGDSVGDSLKKLGQMDSGFDWDIDQDLKANLYFPARGVDQGVVLDQGGVVTKAIRVFDPARYANAIRQSGADGVTPTSLSVSDLATAREGRWDAQFGDTALTTADMVAKTASTNLRLSSQLTPAYTLTLAAGAWGGPGHFWLGDTVTVAVKSGRLVDVVKSRIYEIGIVLDANDVETVTVTAGDVRLDARSVLRGIARRVNRLEQR